MPTYALLGATGATGSAILRYLLTTASRPDHLALTVLVRSKTKLLALFPGLESNTAISISIVEGSSTDPKALAQCLENAEVVFMCVADNNSTPRMSLAADTAGATIDALRLLDRKSSESNIIDSSDQKVDHKQPPTIIQLRSASCNAVLAAQESVFVQWIVWFCNYHVYTDINNACSLFTSASKEGLLELIIVDPPSIHDGEGTQRTGYRVIVDGSERLEPAISYADLGAGFCEAAERRDELKGKAVGVTATGKVNETWGALVPIMVGNAKNRVLGLMGVL